MEPISLKQVLLAELEKMEGDALILAQKLALAKKNLDTGPPMFKASIRSYSERGVSAVASSLEEAVVNAIDLFKRINRRSDILGRWVVVVEVADGIQIPVPQTFWEHLVCAAV